MGFAIVVAQKQAGSERAMLIAHLAHRWAHHGKNVGLVDLSPKKNLTRWINAHRMHNLNLSPSQTWGTVSNVRKSKIKHDVTLVDCPNYPAHLFRSICGECDLVLVPCKPTGCDVQSIAGIAKISASENTPCSALIKQLSAHSINFTPVLTRLADQNVHVLQTRLSNRISFASGFYEGGSSLQENGARPSAWQEIEALRVELETLLLDNSTLGSVRVS